MLELARQLTATGRYAAALVSMEVGAAFNDDPGAAELAILQEWRAAAGWQLPTALQPPPWPDAEAGGRFGAALAARCLTLRRPLVLFLDEIDALQGMTLISVLHQLRAGFQRRPQAFPCALAVIGLRDVCDYKVASGGSERLHTASPFNIKTESLTLRPFTAAEVAELYEQHTADTGQRFTPDALRRAFDLTQGQPWLVNALARQAVQVVVPDPRQPVDVAEINQAKELLIQRQDTHLDNLAERLREARVRHVIEPLLAGGSMNDVPMDDIRFVLDLGLCRMDPAGGLVIANPIYREVIPRVLAGGPQASLPHIRPTWLRPDGSLDPDELLAEGVAGGRRRSAAGRAGAVGRLPDRSGAGDRLAGHLRPAPRPAADQPAHAQLRRSDAGGAGGDGDPGMIRIGCWRTGRGNAGRRGATRSGRSCKLMPAARRNSGGRRRAPGALQESTIKKHLACERASESSP